jgi:hypothetical protein
LAKSGEETTLRECDANIAIYYRMVKKHGQTEYGKVLHHEEMMNLSLDRRLVLMSTNQK